MQVRTKIKGVSSYLTGGYRKCTIKDFKDNGLENISKA